MKKKCLYFVCLISCLLLGGCLGDKSIRSSDSSEPIVATEDYKLYLDAFDKQQDVLKSAVDSQNFAAPVVALTATPASPPDTQQPLGNLRIIIIKNYQTGKPVTEMIAESHALPPYKLPPVTLDTKPDEKEEPAVDTKEQSE